MVMEYWSGWFDLWGDLHHVYSAEGKTLHFADIINTQDGKTDGMFSHESLAYGFFVEGETFSLCTEGH